MKKIRVKMRFHILSHRKIHDINSILASPFSKSEYIINYDPITLVACACLRSEGIKINGTQKRSIQRRHCSVGLMFSKSFLFFAFVLRAAREQYLEYFWINMFLLFFSLVPRAGASGGPFMLHLKIILLQNIGSKFRFPSMPKP